MAQFLGVSKFADMPTSGVFPGACQFSEKKDRESKRFWKRTIFLFFVVFFVGLGFGRFMVRWGPKGPTSPTVPFSRGAGVFGVFVFLDTKDRFLQFQRFVAPFSTTTILPILLSFLVPLSSTLKKQSLLFAFPRTTTLFQTLLPFASFSIFLSSFFLFLSSCRLSFNSFPSYPLF